MAATGEPADVLAEGPGREAQIITLIAEFDRQVSHLSFTEVTRAALAFIGDRLGLARTSLALREEDGGFRIFYSTVDLGGIESGVVLPRNAGTIGQTVERHATIYRPHIPEARPDDAVDKALLAAGLRSSITIPLLCDGRCIGTLNAAARNVDGISPAVRQVMELLAPRMAFAIHVGIAHGQLAESEARFRDVFANVGDGIAVAEIATRKLVMVNPAMCVMLGRSADQLLALSVDAIHPAERIEEVTATFVAMIEGQLDHALEVPMLRGDGSGFLADIVARPTTVSGKPCVVGVFRDAANRRQRERDQVQVQKLESIRTLAAGIAHDFNNVLTGLIGYMSLVQRQLAPDSEPWSMLDEAQRSAFRATALTRQLLTFAKGGAPVREPADLLQIVRDSARLATSGTNVECQFELPARGVWVLGDEGQLAQVIQNVVRNSVEAMPEGGVTRIKVALSASLPIGQGQEARIDVSDAGQGIEPNLLDRLFVPFFTTKSRGSGLGLAVAHSIVRNHGGRITVASKPGAGTTFTIFLPLAEPRASTPAPASVAQHASGRVLVMDDQAVVRRVADRALRAAGYAPSLAASGEEAVAAYREAMTAGQPFSAVILDLTIPGGQGGREVAASILALDPDARIMVSSGYSEDAAMSDHRRYGFCAVLPKPYSAEQLRAAVARMLRDSPPGRDGHDVPEKPRS